MLHPNTQSAPEITLQSYDPLSVLQLSILADEIVAQLSTYRPEFANLARLQRAIGCRVQELFSRSRWQVIDKQKLRLEPQKGNAVRILDLSEIGYRSASDFTPTLNDIGRLPNRQYDRAFAAIIRQKQIWRLYDNGFAHPSTHFFRHVKIKELAANGYDRGYIATWIGEKNPDNLDYYLNSAYYI